jgi:hypothetical protein
MASTPRASAGSGPCWGPGRRGPDGVRLLHLLNELALTAQHLIVIGRGRLLELTAQQASLEDAFMTVTRDAVEFRAPTTIGADQ